MRLLVVTQVIDTQDPVLGFFVEWVRALASRFDRVVVICLKRGAYDLPSNVTVYSLGKEEGNVSRFVYGRRFLHLIWSHRHEYDAVFVHMNQEYLLLYGWLWRLLRKKMYLWRNHYAGSFLTDVAALFCTNVFCTSKHSYTARYKKTIVMPVGVNTDRFRLDAHIPRTARSVLWLGRIAPSKRVEVLLDALDILQSRGVQFAATIVGSPLPEHEAYYRALKQRVATSTFSEQVTFKQGVPNAETPNLYRAHQVFVNTSPSGMLDKTIFEAAGSGCTLLASSADVALLTDTTHHFDSAPELAERLIELFQAPKPTPALAEQHSLERLGEQLVRILS